MAKYSKKRAKQLQHDRFRDTAMRLFDQLGDRLEGKGHAILYGLGAAALAIALVIFFIRWNNRKTDEARRALGRAIAIATAPVSSTAMSDLSESSFSSEQERAKRAVDEFEKVAAKYGDPYRSEARFFMATNLLSIDRDKAIGELIALSKSSNAEVGALSKFTLAQANEADGKYDDAIRLYGELASQNSDVVTPESASLRLALVYGKQGKKREATDLLFKIVVDSRKAKGTNGAALPTSSAASEAAKELQRLDPDRYAQLPPEFPLIG